MILMVIVLLTVASTFESAVIKKPSAKKKMVAADEKQSLLAKEWFPSIHDDKNTKEAENPFEFNGFQGDAKQSLLANAWSPLIHDDKNTKEAENPFGFNDFQGDAKQSLLANAWSPLIHDDKNTKEGENPFGFVSEGDEKQSLLANAWFPSMQDDKYESQNLLAKSWSRQHPRCRRGCLRILDPVCGSDRKTYGNVCLLKSAKFCDGKNIRMLHSGRCEEGADPRCRRGCLRILDPVCGNDKKTYGNECLLKSAKFCDGKNVDLLHRGRCKGKGADLLCRRGCLRILDRVCGSDKKTYGNACLLKSAKVCHGKNVDILHRGRCKVALMDARKEEKMKGTENGANGTIDLVLALPFKDGDSVNSSDTNDEKETKGRKEENSFEERTKFRKW